MSASRAGHPRSSGSGLDPEPAGVDPRRDGDRCHRTLYWQVPRTTAKSALLSENRHRKGATIRLNRSPALSGSPQCLNPRGWFTDPRTTCLNCYSRPACCRTPSGPQLLLQQRTCFAQVQSDSGGVEEQELGRRNKAADSVEPSTTSLELSALSSLFSHLNRRAFSAPDGVHPGDPTGARDRLAMAWDPAAPAPKGWSPHRPPGPGSASGANGFGVVPMR